MMLCHGSHFRLSCMYINKLSSLHFRHNLQTKISVTGIVSSWHWLVLRLIVLWWWCDGRRARLSQEWTIILAGIFTLVRFPSWSPDAAQGPLETSRGLLLVLPGWSCSGLDPSQAPGRRPDARQDPGLHPGSGTWWTLSQEDLLMSNDCECSLIANNLQDF